MEGSWGLLVTIGIFMSLRFKVRSHIMTAKKKNDLAKEGYPSLAIYQVEDFSDSRDLSQMYRRSFSKADLLIGLIVTLSVSIRPS